MSARSGKCGTCQAVAFLKCSGCNAIFYCGKEHQKDHWPVHRVRCRAHETLLSSGLCAFCNKPASLKCVNCRQVYYCDKKHQREDWSKHRESCHGYEVRTTADLGPHLVATRDFKKDDVVLTENPFVVGPSHFAPFPECCVGCGESVDTPSTNFCPRCKWPLCSTVCPGLKDKHGSAECFILSSCKGYCDNNLFWTSLLALRCLLWQKTNPKNWKWIQKMAPFAKTKLADSNKRRLQIKELAIVINNVAVASQVVPDRSLATMEKVFAVLDIYSLCWRNRSKKFLSALYPNAGLLQHSCCSNTRPSFQDVVSTNPDAGKNEAKTGRVTVKTLKDIRRGEVLTCAVTLPFGTTADRQKELLTFKNMRCSCNRCLDPRELGTDYSTLKCTRCSGWVLPIDMLEESDWKCQGKCGTTLSAEAVEDRVAFLNVIVGELAHRVDNVCGRLDKAELIERMALLETYLHPGHQLCFTLKEFAMRYVGNAPRLEEIPSLSDADLEIKAELCRYMLDVIDQLGPSYCRAEGLVVSYLLILAKTKAELTRRKLFSEEWTEEQAASNVALCRRLLQRAFTQITLPNVFDKDEFGEVYTTKIRNEEHAILSWAKSNGLTISEE